jgi:CRP-like cAMP-binding protein
MLKQHIASPKPIATPRAPAIAGPHTLAGAIDMIGAPMHFERNVEIYGEAETAEYIYQVVSGAVRTYKVLEDGRRQIGAFHLPGDVFGLEAGETHAFSAEAVCNSTIRVAKRSAVAAMVTRDSELASDLWAAMSKSLRGAQEHLLLLGRKTAEERVASFLLNMADRTSGSEIVELPMSRQDIADYLGLTIETVSRTLTHLENTAAIELPSSRRIRLRSPGSLQRLDA